MSRSASFKAGAALFALLSVLDLVSMAGITADDAPPAWVLVGGAVLGVVTLAALPAAYRRGGSATAVVRWSRVASALLGLPAFFVDDAPDFAPVLVGAIVVLTLVGLVLFRGEDRAPATA